MCEYANVKIQHKGVEIYLTYVRHQSSIKYPWELKNLHFPDRGHDLSTDMLDWVEECAPEALIEIKRLGYAALQKAGYISERIKVAV